MSELPHPAYLETRLAYESLATRYAGVWTDEKVDWELLDLFLDALPVHARVLDVGAGPGQYARQLALSGHRVTAMDFSETMMQLASGARIADESFVVADMRELPFRSGAFDAVFACASTVHILKNDLSSVLEEFRRVLVPNGTVLVNAIVSELGIRVERDHEMSDSHAAGRTFQHYADADEFATLLTSVGYIVRRVYARTVTSTVVENAEHPTNNWTNFLCEVR